MLKNDAGNNPYIYACPWCDAPSGCLCKDESGKEYTDGSYHRARLMKDCLNLPIENKDEWNKANPDKMMGVSATCRRVLEDALRRAKGSESTEPR